MKQVHPALVQDWEQRKDGGRRAEGGNANPASGSGQRVAAAAIPIPQPAAPRVQVNPQAVSQALAPQAGPVPPPAAAPPPQPAPPAPQRAARGKGKARARPHDDYDYLAINPYASAAPPQHDFNPMADTSLPFHVCGFMFTWPDPDDPDRLIVDTEERDDLPTTVDYRAVESAGIFGEYGPSVGASYGVPRAQAPSRARAPATSNARRPAAEAPSAHPSASASRSDDAEVGVSVDDNLATIAAAASMSSASRPQSQRNTARSRKRKGTDYHGSQSGDDDLGPWIEPEDGGSNRYDVHAIEIDRHLGIGANGEPIPIPKRKRKTRGRQIRALEPPPPPTTTAASAERERHPGKGKERADRESSKTKRRKTVHEDVLQPTPSSATPGPSTSVSASSFRKRAEALFFETDSDSSRSPSPFNVLRSSSPALPPSSSSFSSPSTSRSLARNIPLPPSSSPCGPKQRGPGLDVISISSDSEDEPSADQLDLTLSGDDWLRNIAPFNGTPSAYSQRKARETATQQSVRTAPADMNAEVDDAMDLDLDPESARDSRSPAGALRVQHVCLSRLGADIWLVTRGSYPGCPHLYTREGEGAEGHADEMRGAS